MAGVSAGELVSGLELERNRADRLLRCSRAVEAREKAVELLARRAHSVQELRLKLLRRRYTASEADEALAWLRQRGYLDDGSFARQWTEQRMERHPEGRLALVAGLRRKGVSREVAEAVTGDLCTPETEREAAEAALAKLMRTGAAGPREDGPSSGSGPSPGESERLRRALRRRGFSASLILELLPRR